ncbi:MAG TPA: DUF3341 domain-containing protein [Gemmatimonadaceae bacterium]
MSGASASAPATGRGARLFAEFESAEAMRAALDALRDERYHDLDTYAPFDIPELDEPLGLGRSWLGWLVFAGGLAGLVLSYGIQWWADVYSYPLAIGGRPRHAVPAFVPATFEGTVLVAALAAFFGLLVVLRLPRLWAPEDEIEDFERATIDRFWISIGTLASDLDRAHAEQLLRRSGARRVVTVGR